MKMLLLFRYVKTSRAEDDSLKDRLLHSQFLRGGGTPCPSGKTWTRVFTVVSAVRRGLGSVSSFRVG